MPRAVFYGELRDGKRKRGAPKKRFKDQLKRPLNLTSIKEQHWESNAKDRYSWRAATKQGAMHFEAARRADLDESVNGGRLWQPRVLQMGGSHAPQIGLFSHPNLVAKG